MLTFKLVPPLLQGSLSLSLSGFKVLRKGSHREGLGTLVALETGTPKKVGFAAIPFDSSCSIGTWDRFKEIIFALALISYLGKL